MFMMNDQSKAYSISHGTNQVKANWWSAVKKLSSVTVLNVVEDSPTIRPIDRRTRFPFQID